MIKQKITVTQVNDTVKLCVGNVTMDFDYETALELGLRIQHRGKQAKLFAGDLSRNWRTLADLSTVEENYKRFIEPNLKYTDPAVKNLGGGT